MEILRKSNAKKAAERGTGQNRKIKSLRDSGIDPTGQNRKIKSLPGTHFK